MTNAAWAILLLTATTAADSSVEAADRVAASQLQGSHPIDVPLALLRRCAHRFETVRDYTANLVTEERLGKKLPPATYQFAKFRQRPFSVYLRWLEPNAGREVIYVEGQNEDKMLTHPTGIAKALTGTVKIDPDGALALRENRHSIREVGIGAMIRQLIARWEFERQYDDTEVAIEHVKVNGRPCWLIVTIHPQPDAGKYMFHTLKVYVDKKELLPIRLEGYGYPREPGRQPGDLLEAYTFLDLEIDPGLSDLDFSPSNPEYRFARF